MWSYSYHHMERDIARLQMKYGEIIKKEVIGKSYEGRNLYALRIGGEKKKRKLVYTAGIHAREWMNCRLMMDKAKEVAKRCSKGKSGCEYVILPMLNPDGVMISQQTKEKKRIRENARGVDLNRNFSCGWNRALDGSHGKKKISERETKAMVSFMKSLDGIVAVIHFHSSGEEIIFDYSAKAKLRARNRRMAVHYAKRMGYRLGEASTDVTPNGGFGEWCVFELGVPSITVETGKCKCPLRLWEYWWVRLFCDY